MEYLLVFFVSSLFLTIYEIIHAPEINDIDI